MLFDSNAHVLVLVLGFGFWVLGFRSCFCWSVFVCLSVCLFDCLSIYLRIISLLLFVKIQEKILLERLALGKISNILW